MCGKFTQMMSWRDLRDLSDLIGAPRPFEFDEAVIGSPSAVRMMRASPWMVFCEITCEAAR